MSDLAPAAPAGWYADPWQPGHFRWFDGGQWTAHAAPGVAPAYGYGYQQPRDRSVEALLPVNRSGWAIAAGYAGLFSILLIFAPIAILLGVLALNDLKDKPAVGGRGRAWFGIIAGALGTLGLLAASFS
jgi:hypothetical protein